MLLSLDDHGNEVSEVQESLLKLYDPEGGLTVDGWFGPVTTAHVLDLQRARGLATDGVVGPRTQWTINEAIAGGWRPANPKPVLGYLSKVPYKSQLDNEYRPSGTCNVTCLAMALEYLGAQPKHPDAQFEDELYALIMSQEGMAFYREFQSRPENEWARNSSIGPYTVHAVLAWAASRYGVTDRFTTQASRAQIVDRIQNGRPVIVNGDFTGYGHIVLCIGVTAGYDMIVHDPWGDWMRGYRKRNGKARVYPAEKLNAVMKESFSGDRLRAHLFES